MKRICILLALVLALGCVSAMAAEGDAMMGRSDTDTLYFNYCFTSGDTLYMTNWDGQLYSCRVGDADLTAYTYIVPEGESEGDDVALRPFAEGGRLYALCLVSRLGDITEFIGASLEELTIEDGGVRREKLFDVDWGDLVEYYEDNAYPIRPDAIIGAGGKAIMRHYNLSGEPVMTTLDLATGEMKTVDTVRDVVAITDFKDGAVLVESYNYNTPDVAYLYAYDPADDSAQLMAEVAVEEYNPLQGLAYDAETGTAYCVRSGEVRPLDLQTGEVGEGVTDMPVESYGSAGAACVLPGSYYAFCYEGAVIRNLDPAQRAQTKLKINDYSWIDSVSTAYYRFANSHGDISVVLSRDYSESEKLIESMMNRDDGIDIYVLGATTSTYSALYNRGYLMELDGNPRVAALAEAMYPALREALSTDGHLVALPVWFSGSTLGISNEAMQAMGLTIDDIPDNWPDFLDFLRGYEGKVNEDSPACLFYSGMSAENARYSLFMALFEDYGRYINLTDATIAYDTPLLRSLIEKLEQVDFTALGCPTQQELDDEAFADQYMNDNRPVLIQTDCGCVIGGFYGENTPMLMRVDPDTPAPLALEAIVAVINPYSKNMDAALEFMGELADDLSDAVRYNLDPTLSEPVRGKWSEESIAELNELVDSLRADLEKAEAADKQMLEDNLRDVEANLADMEKNGWEISPREIEWYRAHDDALALAGYNWLYDTAGEQDGRGDAWTLITQYLDGQIDSGALLSGIDRKVQMMLQEGN